MRKLENNFRDGGFDYCIVEREGDVVLAAEVREDKSVRGYMVFHVRKYADREIMGNFSPAHESVPPAESWGDEGWSYGGGSDKEKMLEMAFDKFVQRVEVRSESPVISDGPTGGKRGRARAEFELDISGFAGKEFEFSDLAARFSDTPEPMLRNRLKTEVDAGNVKVVRQIAGGRGKPRNVYEVA